MTCSDFVASLSEYIDGAAPEEALREAEEHLAGCPSCRRYRDVVERGLELVRGLPQPEVPEDFQPRLQHRLYHVDAGATLGGPASSVAPGLTVVGVALVFAAVAWAPMLRAAAPEVELPAIEVSRPPMALRYRSTPAYPFNVAQDRRSHSQPSVRPADLWDDAPALFSEYSILSHRHRGSSMERVGLEQDR
jgi:anti-sigma factor RsiW